MRSRALALFALLWAAGASARVLAQDSPSAVLFYPYVASHTSAGIDTVIQLTNTSEDNVEARCFYEDLTPDCSSGVAGESCAPGPVTCTGICVPALQRRPFRVRITPSQPLAWRVSAGLANAPLDGVERVGPDGANNQGTDVPAIGAAPFTATLRCVVVGTDPTQPLADNVLVGLATLEERSSAANGLDKRQYRAIGFPALTNGDGPDRDEFLLLGGPDAEYQGCPALLALEHFNDAGPLRTGERTAHVQPGVVLSACTAPLTGPGQAVAQFTIFNEFGQRFSNSRAVEGQLVTRLALLDTNNPERSIFAAGVQGTLAGQSLIRGHGSGLVGVGLDSHLYPGDLARSVAVNVHGTGGSATGDFVAFRAPLCPGDCDLNGAVRINELVTGVNIALGELTVDRCEAMDQNRNFAVAINELVTATRSAIRGCPESTPPATPTPAPSPTPLPPAVAPEITWLGLASADDRPLLADETDGEGREVFERPFGQGMTIVVEARGPRPIGRNTYLESGLLPDLQLLVSNPLGDGGAEVCENDGHSGGVPGDPELDFAAPGAAAAVNDLGCRAFDRQGVSTGGFTRPMSAGDVWQFVVRGTQVQFGVPIARAWAFPIGDTVVAARVRDGSGALSAVREIVVRITPP